MILIASSSSDTYITNKIIDSTRAVSGNIGRAGTLDLFKLYDESTTVTGAIELSRILIKFDLEKAKALSTSTLKIDDESFTAKLKIHNITTGQPSPSNFTVQVFPLAESFTEGFGRDVISFADVGACNFEERSQGVQWNLSGASQSGSLGDSNVDYYTIGDLQDGFGVVNLGSTQLFEIGTEDLVIDVTRVVSATLAGIIPDCGFRISFTDSQENDDTTRFVKRFASRHVRQQSLKPTLLLSYDDSIIDNHSSSYFDAQNSLYVHNILRGEYTDFTSGSSLTPIIGDSCLLVRLSTGSFTTYVTGSQVKKASDVTGIYSADFSISSNDLSAVTGTSSIRDFVIASGSITMDEVWSSLDETVTFFSSSLTIKQNIPSTKAGGLRKIRSSMLSTPAFAQRGQQIKVRVSFFDDYEQNRSSKFAFEPAPLETASCKIRIRDLSTGALIFDFDEPGSKMSRDALSNYYDLQTDSMPTGIPLVFEYQIAVAGEIQQVTSKNFTLVLSE